MMKYSEQGYVTTPLNTSVEIEDALSPAGPENKVSLTALWECAIRTQTLPESLDLNIFFETIHERLHDPEWEVRQHALRVLVDFIPLIPPETLDIKIESILSDLVTNLGHLGPAVRKGAVDSLRAYVAHSRKTDQIIRDLVERGVEKSQENKVHTNVVLGIILSLPYLINNKLSDNTLTYIIHKLLDKIVKVVHQETVLRSLLRIREIAGHELFNRSLASHETYNSRKQFDLLCEVYDLHTVRGGGKSIGQYRPGGSFEQDVAPPPANRTILKKDTSGGTSNAVGYDDDGQRCFDIENDKVILETEIKLDSGPAITMKIHEENLDAAENNNIRHRPFKVLPDDSEPEDYDHLRRTPRRVRFGGEIVKLRTPDSDSNIDDNDTTISITSETGLGEPVIEIKYIENETRMTTRTSRSLIPIPIKSHTQSAPSSPSRSNLQKSRVFTSSPNLSKSRQSVPKIYGPSRIPRRFNTEVKKSVERKIQIRINENPTKTKHGRSKMNIEDENRNKSVVERSSKTVDPKTVDQNRSSKADVGSKPTDNSIKDIITSQIPESKIALLDKPKDNTKPKLKSPNAQNCNTKMLSRRNSRDGEFSPAPIHNEIEVMHNLTRSPSPTHKLKTTEIIKLPEIRPASAHKSGFASFQLYKPSEPFYDFADSPIPIRDSGECLTCSSSGSDTAAAERRLQEGFGMLDARVIQDLQNNDDIRARQRGLDELLRAIQQPTVLESLEERLPTLLYILFNAEQQPMLQPTAEQTLSILFMSINQQCLTARLQQISLSLSKSGSPLGVRLAILLMRRIPPRLLVDQLLSDPILGAKSSKIREGALQILMTVSRIFPSTDLNIPQSVASVVAILRDRKRKVRQAALETLAALAQLSSPTMVMDYADEITTNWTDREQILKVIRTRLSRKQLPAVNMNGNIRYSTPTGESEIEWLSRGSGSLSPQHRSARKPEDPNNNLSRTWPTQIKSSALQNSPRKRFYSAQTESIDKQTGSLLESHLPDERQARRFISSALNFASSDSLQSKKHFLPSFSESSVGGFESEDENRNVVVEEDGFGTVVKHVDVIESFESKFLGSASEAAVSGESAISLGYENEAGRVSRMGGANGKVNYWRSNSRRELKRDGEDIESDWSRGSKEDPVGRAPTTQIWAIDPSAFNASEKLSTANGTLRQIYLVKTNESKSTSTNTVAQDYKEGATNTSPVYNKKPPRGRSFSPPGLCKHSDCDSCDELESSNRRFVNVGYERRLQTYRREERVRKSFSSEHLSDVERLRKDNVSSGSSSGSSIRQTGNWNRDLRSGIPVPIHADKKLRIRNRNNTHKPKGPLSIPYYPPVKSPSPQTTPEKFTIPEPPQIRQPFSSGSESSGYFTPQPDPTPEPSPQPERRISAAPERFIQLESPAKNFTIIDSDVETVVDDDEEQLVAENVEQESPVVTNTEELPREEKSNSIDETDFTHISFTEKRALSKSEVDITISAVISRKNVNSAPALSDFESIDTKTSIPGSIVDSLEDTEAPQELQYSSPVKTIPTPKKSAQQSSFRRKSCRVSSTNVTLYPDSLRPFSKPKEAYNEVTGQLESSEWEVTMKGLQGLVRLIRHHKEFVENQMHAVCVLLGKQIRNLRSQVARAACLAASELFGTSKRPLELEVDELAGPLLHRTADTNKFLRSDANAALDEMSANLSVPKVVQVVTYRGCGHQNAVVRCAAARLLCNIVHKLGPEKIFQLPRDTRDKILLSSANMLTEGSLETRKHAKMLLGTLSKHCQFQRAMTESVPATILRHIDKTMKSLVK